MRIVEDKLDSKPKGFGYVEFKTLDGLKKALNLSGTQFQGRNIRISVAEPRKFPYYNEWSLAESLQKRIGKNRRETSATGLEKDHWQTLLNNERVPASILGQHEASKI